MIDGLVPVLLMLVDADQMLERRRHLRIHGDEVSEQRLGTVEQAGTHVVLAEFEQCDGLFLIGKIRTRDQVLVHADSTIDLAAAAEQVAERQMRFDCVAVELGELEEHLDRLVRLLVQQVVQSAKVTRRQLADAGAARALAVAPADDPAGQGSDRQQHGQHDDEDRRRWNHCACSGAAGASATAPAA